MKKIISLLWVLTLLVSSAFPVSVSATDYNDDYDNSEYPDLSIRTSSDGNYEYQYIPEHTGGIRGLKLIRYSGKKKLPKNYTVPETIDDTGYYVFCIANGAFSNCDTLEHVTITNYTAIEKNAFSNCKNLKTVTLPEIAEPHSKSLGYYKNKKVAGFTINCTDTDIGYCPAVNTAVYYANKNNFKCNYLVKSTREKTIKFRAGAIVTIKVDNKSANEWKSSDPKIAKITSKGKLTILKRGSTTLTAKLKNGRRFKRVLKVADNPRFLKNDKVITSVSVKKGGTVSVKIYGKASGINNIYKNTKIAKVTSKKTVNVIKVKGLKAGSTTLKITVNGKVLNLRVKVTK